MEQSLLEQLQRYDESDYYPFHMPGHKRNKEIDYIPVGIDITEIEGFDNLHHAEGILKDAQDRAAALYGADESFFLINGSTAGILSAISAAVPKGKRMLMARNCHKAAYHGVFLRELDVDYLYPDVMGELDIYGGIRPEQVEEMLVQKPDTAAVFITSPTYEGMVSNIEKIAEVVHERGKILIVDEAHGAHLGIGGEGFPNGALDGGADLVIQSLHKTLPSMTQTAILHVQGSRVDRARLRKYLQIYQTSSPSYVFMAGMDSCIRLMERQGKQLFDRFLANLDNFYEKVKELKHLHVLTPEEAEGTWGVKAMDPSKLCIFTTGTPYHGAWLYDKLLEEYHLQMEMCAGNYVLAMTSMMDTEEGYERLIKALRDIDRHIESQMQDGCEAADCENPVGGATDRQDRAKVQRGYLSSLRGQVVKRSAEVEDLESDIIRLEDSIGRVAKEYRYVYPPGVPVLVPGEVITREVVEVLRYYEAADLNVLGQEHGRDVIEVVKQ